jgi:DNA (cytosine-5)-methyltransferase 1
MFTDNKMGALRTIADCGDKGVLQTDYRIRKLTPKECFRLMGFSDEDFDKAKWYTIEESRNIILRNSKKKNPKQYTYEERLERVSDSQLYKQAGNSIVTRVLLEIYKELYKAMPYLFEDIKLSSFFSGVGAFEKALDMLEDYINNGNAINQVNFTQPPII